MKCPICKKEISELEEVCPCCKTNFDEYEKDSRSKETRHEGLGCGIVLLILVAIIFVPMIFNSLSDLNKTKQEGKLIQEGEIISAGEISKEFAQLISESKYNDATKYLAEDCKLIDSNNNERIKLEYCLEKLNVYKSHTIEQRGNDLKDQATYRILWNGTTYENTKQIITLNLRKKINKQEITYEIIRVIFTDNTLAF